MERKERKERKPYNKPSVTRIKLDARGAVLGFCKTDVPSRFGPGETDCNAPAYCTAPGS